jgi:hypothetical protein
VTLPEGEGSALVGWLLVGTGLLDLGLAVFFGFVRPLAHQPGRRVFPLALALGALVLMGVGAAYLRGALAPR